MGFFPSLWEGLGEGLKANNIFEFGGQRQHWFCLMPVNGEWEAGVDAASNNNN